MASKKEVMDGFINHQTYLGSEIKTRINSISMERKDAPTTLKKGDVYSDVVGAKKRPCVIIKIKNGIVFAIPLTSSENVHNLTSYNSRFFGEGWFSNTYTITTEDIVKENFLGVFDNTKNLNEGIKALREFIKKNI